MDPADQQIRRFECVCCAAPVARTWGFVRADGRPYAVYFANSYRHTGQPRDTWIDVILGTWDTDEADDHTTFGCRVGPDTEGGAPAATVVPACLDGSAGRAHGQVLDREEALAHARLPEFWEVVNLVLDQDATVHAHLNGPGD